jgi:hypothetical protein
MPQRDGLAQILSIMDIFFPGTWLRVSRFFPLCHTPLINTVASDDIYLSIGWFDVTMPLNFGRYVSMAGEMDEQEFLQIIALILLSLALDIRTEDDLLMVKLMLNVNIATNPNQDELSRFKNELTPPLEMLRNLNHLANANFAVRAEIVKLIVCCGAQDNSLFGQMCARVSELYLELESNGLTVIEYVYTHCPDFFERPLLKCYIPEINYVLKAMNQHDEPYRKFVFLVDEQICDIVKTLALPGTACRFLVRQYQPDNPLLRYLFKFDPSIEEKGKTIANEYIANKTVA